MSRTEITVYAQWNKLQPFFCEECKPRGKSEKITLVVSDYDHFCAGCGESFIDIAEPDTRKKLSATDVREKYQRILSDESAFFQQSPFKSQLLQDERYIKYLAMHNAMQAFNYVQKTRVCRWLQKQLAVYQNDVQHNIGVQQVSQWSTEAIQAIIDDLK